MHGAGRSGLNRGLSGPSPAAEPLHLGLQLADAGLGCGAGLGLGDGAGLGLGERPGGSPV